MEERRVLRDDANCAPERRELQPTDVLAVDEDAPVRGLVEAEEEAEDGRLAAAGGPDERDLLPCGDREGEVAEDGAVRVVPKVDMLECDCPTTKFKGFCVPLVLQQEVRYR